MTEEHEHRTDQRCIFPVGTGSIKGAKVKVTGPCV